MSENKGLKARMDSERQCMKRITNDDLVCNDCTFVYDDAVKFGNTSVCEKFAAKPNQVLLGGDCDEYERKDEG